MTTERIEEKQTVLADIVAQTISEWAENWTRTRAVSDRNGGEFKIPGCQWRFSADRPSDEEVEEPESVLQFMPTFQRGYAVETFEETSTNTDQISGLFKYRALIRSGVSPDNSQSRNSLKTSPKEERNE